ncbi:DUF3718 domain-containing protein [Planctobacterium marinum]|uniref:DUF3718 domain-containing protein n=1 Tax=Planctobacterium marinum TaxID=1631968 RepID=UPI001E38205D|nr:DUF3718 domain-containing protein [Planctobacterium marinum]MCC2603798.1 DUF3718 domain-containing protein [Planctobacterium marinum]
MKKLILTAIAATSVMISGASFAGDKLVEYKLENLCKAVKSDNRFDLYKAIKRNNLQADEVVEGLMCNGEDPITFAKLNGAEKTANLLIERSGFNGKTVIIEDLAKN